MKKIEKIEILGVDNGISAKIGCKTLVYQQKDLKQFLKDLGDYFIDPEKTQKKIYKRYGIEEWVTSTGSIIIDVGEGYVSEREPLTPPSGV